MHLTNIVYPSQGSSNSNVSGSNIIDENDIDKIINSVVADELYNYIKKQDNDKIILQTSTGDRISIKIESDFSYATMFSFLFLAVFLLSVIGFTLKDLNNDKRYNDENELKK